MAQGVPTSDEKKLEFAEAYLRLGFPAQAARKVGIPERTGYALADVLDEDPEFAERRRRLHAKALDRAEAAVMRSIDVLSDRLENATELLGGGEGEPMKVLDKSADYGRSIAALNDSLMKRRKIEDDIARGRGPQSEGGPVEVVIRVTGEAKTESETVSVPDVSSG